MFGKHFLSLFLLLTIYQTGVGQQIRKGKPGAPGTWHIIGTTEARFTADHDGIVVVPPFDNFRMLQIKVTDAPLRLMKLQVTYGDGVPDIIPVKIDIPQGGTSRHIDLRGTGTRHIRRIDFWYDTRNVTHGRANVTVLGMK